MVVVLAKKRKEPKFRLLSPAILSAGIKKDFNV
jgi:hypothetical protein